MRLKKLLIWTSIISLLIAGFYFAYIQLAKGFERFPSPSLTSDVPVSSELDWWNANDDLKVTTFEMRSLGEVSRGLINSGQPFVIEFRIAGTARCDQNKPPFIESVFVSDRFDETKDGRRWVDIQVRPRSNIRNFHTSVGMSHPFDVCVQRAYRTYQWGPNEYRAECHGLSSTVTIQQSK